MIKFLRYFFFVLLLSLSSYTISFAIGNKNACSGDPLTLNYSSTNYTSCTSGVFAIDAPPGYAGLASPNTSAGNHSYNPGNAGTPGAGKVFSFTCGGISPDTATLNVYACSCAGTNSGTACSNTVPVLSDTITTQPSWTNAGAGSGSCTGAKCQYYTAAGCSAPNSCGTPGSCYAPSGCNNACGSTAVNDCAGTCGGSATDYNGGTAGCGTAPSASVAPLGYLDAVSSGVAGSSCGMASGWSYDPDKTNQSIEVHVYVNNSSGVQVGAYNTGVTNVYRSDVSTGGVNHGFGYQIPSLTAGTFYVYAFGIGINSSGVKDDMNPLLTNSPKTITCTAPAGDACGTGSSATPLLSEPTGGSACSSGALNSSSPADVTTSGSQAWNWSCGTVTSCTAPKYGCRITTDSNYSLAQYGANGPNNNYGCAGTCANGGTDYSTCTPPAVTYTITASAGSNGTISPSGAVLITQGASRTFTVTPTSGYTASVAGTCGGSLSGTTYTTNVINANCTVTASFSLSSCSAPNSCGTPGSCYAPSGCNNACGSTAVNDCAGTCGGSAIDYNGGTAGCGLAPVACVGSWSNNGICSVNIAPPPNNCGLSGIIQQTYTIATPSANGGAPCPYANGATQWGPTSCSTSACPSGSFNPASASCEIPDNSNSCSANVSWTTTVAVPGYTSAVTKDGTAGNFQTGNNGGPIAFLTNYSSQIYRLYNYGRELDTITVSSDCKASSARSAGQCLPCQNGGCGNPPILPHVCNNGANNPPSCNQCPANLAWYAVSSSCGPCTNGGCTGTIGGSSANPNGNLVCNNTSNNVPICTPKPNQTIRLNGGTNIYISNYVGNNAMIAWAPGSNSAPFPYSSCTIPSGNWSNPLATTMQPTAGSGLTDALSTGGSFGYSYQCQNLGGSTLSSATVNICPSTSPISRSNIASDCRTAPGVSLSLTPGNGGQYTPSGKLLVGVSDSVAGVTSCRLYYDRVTRQPNGEYIVTASGVPDVVVIDGSRPTITVSGNYYVLCNTVSSDGHTFTARNSTNVEFRSEPPNPIVSLKQTPASIAKGSASVISWVVQYPNPVQSNPSRASLCTLTADVVCIGGFGNCKPEQITAQTAANSIITTGFTDTDDLGNKVGGPRLISGPGGALNTIVEGTAAQIDAGDTDWKAYGKKTFVLDKTMDFTLDCGTPGPYTKAKVRVQVTSSNEG